MYYYIGVVEKKTDDHTPSERSLIIFLGENDGSYVEELIAKSAIRKSDEGGALGDLLIHL